MDKKNNLIDLSLIYLTRFGDEDQKEFALDDLITRYKRIAFKRASLKHSFEYEKRSAALLTLVKLINEFDPAQEMPLHLYIERELYKRWGPSRQLCFENKNINIGLNLSNEIKFIQSIYSDYKGHDVANLLQIPYAKGDYLLLQVKKYGFTPLFRQINNVQWLVLYNLNQDDLEASYSRLNQYLGLSIGHIKKIESWSKYEIFRLMGKNGGDSN